MSTPWRLDWSHGSLYVEPVGAMLGPVEFRLDDGRVVQPFDVFPWADEPAAPGSEPITGLLARGRGDWPCLPFGYVFPRDQLAPAWLPYYSEADEGPAHGHCANEPWTLVEHGPARIVCTFDNPPDAPIARLTRIIEPVPGAAAIRCELVIEARRACRMPLGLHPTLKLPAEPGAFEIRPGRFAFGRTFAGLFEPGASRLAVDAVFERLDAVPDVDGGTLDLTRLPLPRPSEDLLQLCGVDGEVEVLDHAARYRLRLSWDGDAIPGLVLWISNGGRSYHPWNGRHYGLGVEPVAAAYNLGVAVSNADNPIAQAGVATTVAFDPATPWRTEYRFTVAGL